MGLPRLDVVFCFWQCDKKNHGWREGPPVTVLCQSFRSDDRAFTLRLNQFRPKKEYNFTFAARQPLNSNIGRLSPTTRSERGRRFLQPRIWPLRVRSPRRRPSVRLKPAAAPHATRNAARSFKFPPVASEATPSCSAGWFWRLTQKVG
jgi:hypothetical protein